MPRTTAQYPSTTSPASSSTPGSPAAATPVTSRGLSIRTTPTSLDAQGTGAAAAGSSLSGAASALDVSWGCRLRCRGLPTLLQNASFDGAQPPHFAAHLDLRVAVYFQHRLGHISQKVVLTVAMRYPRKLGGNRGDERILLVRHPPPHGLGQAVSPLTGQDDQTLHLLRRTRQQGLSKPHPLAHQLAHHIERLMAFFRL